MIAFRINTDRAKQEATDFALLICEYTSEVETAKWWAVEEQRARQMKEDAAKRVGELEDKLEEAGVPFTRATEVRCV